MMKYSCCIEDPQMREDSLFIQSAVVWKDNSHVIDGGWRNMAKDQKIAI